MRTPKVLGILAHVDAGKTTLSEQILYRSGALRAPGRVDHGDAALDADPIERERGITVFADQACFELDGARFTLMDTPGHVDFMAEAERALLALDMAILLIDGGGGVRAHTVALYRLAQRYGVPMMIFINKTDLFRYDAADIDRQLRERLGGPVVRVENGLPDLEQLSMLSDDVMSAYLDGHCGEKLAWDELTRLFAERKALPTLSGAALSGTGVDALLDAVARLSRFERPRQAAFEALCYKVRHDPGGDRVTYLKIQSGLLRPRAAFRVGDATEKIHQLRRYQGAEFTPADEAGAGDAVGVTGLLRVPCGARLIGDALAAENPRFHTQPALAAWVEPPGGVAPAAVLEKLRVLEDEDPLLDVVWDAAHSAVSVRVMGTVQMEVLKQVLQNRFGLNVRFLPPRVLYQETIAAPTVGCGHYEPLRHYAEVHLRLSPAPRGEGISFDSACHVDDLTLNYQNLIRTHVFEKRHKGVLTGSPLTDVRVTLLSGRAHLKHTEGGDFREAAYRAIRQGLEKAQSVLLEPFYRFTLTVPPECLGRAMTDIAALSGTCGAPETIGDETRLTGRAPVATLMDYPAVLRAYTHGRGALQLQMDGYDLCHNPEEIIAETAYQKDADLQNASSSVFCSHGAGFTVPWTRADALMHLPVEEQ